MLISKSLPASLWSQTFAREVTRPVFPSLPSGIRPYLLATGLLAGVSALMYVGDSAMMRFGFSWALVSLLVVVISANLWGIRPALLVLALSALYGAVIVPHIQPAPTALPRLNDSVIIMRTALFLTCGAATVWLTYRAQLMQGKAETRREVVKALRSTLLPNTLAHAPGYNLSGVYKPLYDEEEVGGDFYDFYPISEGRYGILIGDVMGKGKEAASSIAFLRYSVRAFISSGMPPAQAMEQLNHMIETQDLKFEMATLFLGCLDAESGSLSYASAGHEPPLLRRACGKEETLDATGPVLGIGLEMPYDQEAIVLESGDALLLMTDGVTEARNARGQFLQSEGIWRYFRSASSTASAQKSLATIASALNTYIGSNRSDDIAMLLIRRQSTL